MKLKSRRNVFDLDFAEMNFLFYRNITKNIHMSAWEIIVVKCRESVCLCLPRLSEASFWWELSLWSHYCIKTQSTLCPHKSFTYEKDLKGHSCVDYWNH